MLVYWTNVNVTWSVWWSFTREPEIIPHLTTYQQCSSHAFIFCASTSLYFQLFVRVALIKFLTIKPPLLLLLAIFLKDTNGRFYLRMGLECLKLN